MEWINKENCRSSKNKTIPDIFKVKKCLFDTATNNKSEEANSPVASSSWLMDIPGPREESPYSLFKVRKKKVFSRSLNENSSTGTVTATPTHKKRSEDDALNEEEEMLSGPLFQSPSTAIQRAMLDPDLIGDFTKPCALPIIKGRHPDLKTITPRTLASVLQGARPGFKFRIIDCRYPYEFEGGHIMTAENIYAKDDIENFLDDSVERTVMDTKDILIFYCEFSSERGPSMLRHLRSKDRDMNKDYYPFLYYPELYILEGGYKAFYTNFKELCDPQEYKMMLDKDCAEDLAYYRAKCKSWNRQSKRLKRTRSSLIF